MTFHASSDTPYWNDTGYRKAYVIKAPGREDDESGSTVSDDMVAPGVDILPPTRRKVPMIPIAGMPRGLEVQLGNLSLTEEASTEPGEHMDTGRGSKRS